MNCKRIGIFDLGHENVEVYVRDGTGGDFSFQPDNHGPARIRVGMDYQDFQGVATAVLHEGLEFLLLRGELAYRSTGKTTFDCGDRLFVFDHPECVEVCSRLAPFLLAVLPRLSQEFVDFQKRKRKGQ